MGEIHEKLILEDQFSASFSRFIEMGGDAASNMDSLGTSSQQFADMAAYAGQQLNSMKNALASQQSLYDAQFQRLQAQRNIVEQMAESYVRLAAEKGMDAQATIRAGEALEKAQNAETLLFQQSLQVEQTIARQNEAIMKFAGNINTAQNATWKAADTQQELTKSVEDMAVTIGHAADTQQKLTEAVKDTASASDRAADAQQRNTEKIENTANASFRAANAQRRHNREVASTDMSARQLLSTVSRIAAVLGGIKIGRGILELSDTMAQTQARLDMMINQIDSGAGNVNELQEMIYQSANRARGEYQATADAVSKLGLMAGDAFGSSEEVVVFMEQINKQFKIAGTEASGIQAAMLQLTQAMGSGVLRGEEYNSILEQAPNIIQTIADYMEVPKGQLKDMAAEGKITADIVKAAMFAAADETNAKFESIPMTYSDAWTMIRNAGINALGDVSNKLNSLLNSAAGQKAMNGIISGINILSTVASGAIDMLVSGANWVAENWDYVYPVLIGIGAAFVAAGAAGVISGLSTAAAWSPVTFIVLGIGAAVSFLVFALRQSGVEWQTMGEVAGGVLGTLYSYFYTVVAYWWNLMATFAEFFANVFNDPVAAIANLFAALLDNILSVVQTAASAIDALLGSDISGAVAGFRNDVSDWVTSKYGENQIKIKRMSATDVGTNIDAGRKMGRDFGQKLDDLNFNLGDFTKHFGNGMEVSGLGAGDLDIGKVGSVGNVKNIEGDIRLSDEDVKLYRDLAERRYMNQVELKTLAPNINVTIPAGASGNLSAGDVADHIRKMLIEEMSANTAVSHG